MYCPNEMRINKAREVAIPRNKDLFCRVGRRDSIPMPSEESMPMNMSKIDQLLYMDSQLGEQAAQQRRQSEAETTRNNEDNV